MMMLRTIILIGLTVSGLWAGPERWEKDISKLEEAARKNPPPKGGLLFVGSSSIRLWDLKSALPERNAINCGFGGSEVEDSVYYADRLVIPHEPSIVFLYAGDNDIGGGKSAERVVADYRRFVKTIHAALPQTQIVFLPIKPSLARWEKWPEMNEANQTIKKLSGENPLLHFLDTISPSLTKDGQPDPALFQKDGLHLNAKGYAVWNKVVRDWLATLKDVAPPSGE